MSHASIDLSITHPSMHDSRLQALPAGVVGEQAVVSWVAISTSRACSANWEGIERKGYAQADSIEHCML